MHFVPLNFGSGLIEILYVRHASACRRDAHSIWEISRRRLQMVKDLSTHHHLIGNLFKSPVTSEEWTQYRLSDEQVDFYRENGYLAGIRLLNDEQIEVLREDLAALVDPGHPGNKLFYEFNS